MTGPQLWQTFLDAKIPGTQLRALGEDLGFQRKQASPAGQRALLGLAVAIIQGGNPQVIPSRLLGLMLAAMPGGMLGLLDRKVLLEDLGMAYARDADWTQLTSGVQRYIHKVAQQI